MHRCAKLIGALGGVASATACTAPPPSGPTVMSIPPPGKELAIFQQEDGHCRNYAAATIGLLPAGPPQPQTAGGTSSAPLGNADSVATGATYAAASSYNVQTRYNIAYTQCTYASGNAILPLPASVYGYYAYAGEDYPWYGGPWFEWGGLGFAGGGVFVFNRDHDFHHGFHDGFHGNPHGGGMHGGGMHGGGRGRG